MRTLAAVLVAAGLAAGCAGRMTYPGSVDHVVAPGFDARRPADVSVLPVAGGALDGDTAAVLREALRGRLRELKYAPVRLDAIDRAPAEFRPGGANAVLEIKVDAWDADALYGDGSLRFTAEVRLFGPGSLDVLYRGTVKGVTVRASQVARSMDDRPMTLEQACAEAASVLLEGLPVKSDG
jgi:uncharacterized protein YbjQ (UPF0145 family)